MNKKQYLIIIVLEFVLIASILAVLFSSNITNKSYNYEQQISRSDITEYSTNEPALENDTSLELQALLNQDLSNTNTCPPTFTPAPTIAITPYIVISQTKADEPTAYIKYVYITDTGSKYHRYSCHYLKYSCYEITLESAKRKGYEPCKVCKP